MNLERIQLLRDIMTRVESGERAEPKFSMMDWLVERDDDVYCGTAACAGGHLCLDPRAKALGLTLMPYAGGAWHEPCYGRLIGFPALEAFLEIGTEQAYFLFDPHHYVDTNPAVIGDDDEWATEDEMIESIQPRHVLARIDTLIGEFHAARKVRNAKPRKRAERKPRGKKQQSDRVS